ncbi:hypothetical protein LshimejAT787_1501720 [Lyophyllum shimeji]|uniref:Uncharacterized protein n=1 Tax=Lyophyllum shimeji TaxID=47721 RepID=A0A9P3USV2_LYOSH|nr:hypothetical protein LshimejAT787_1501720 [Lyophyllum shimeji]
MDSVVRTTEIQKVYGVLREAMTWNGASGRWSVQREIFKFRRRLLPTTHRANPNSILILSVVTVSNRRHDTLRYSLPDCFPFFDRPLLADAVVMVQDAYEILSTLPDFDF